MLFGEDKFNRCDLYVSISLEPKQIMLASNSGIRYKTLKSEKLNLTELDQAVEQMRSEIPNSDQEESYWELYLTPNHVEQYNQIRNNRNKTFCLLVA